MKSHFRIVLLALIFAGCVSENEQKGLDHIADLYDGEASYSKSFNSEAGVATMTKFNVKLKGSERIDSLQPTVTTANIAVLLFESLSESEKKDYTHIDVELINSKSDTASYYYPMDVIQKISHKSKSYKTFSQSLVDGNFEKIDEIKNDKAINQSVANGLKSQIDKMESKLGNLRGYEPFGIAEASDEQGTVYQFQGYLVFGTGIYKPYLTVVDAEDGKDELIGFKIF